LSLNSKTLKTAFSESFLIIAWCGGIFFAQKNVDLPQYLLWFLYAFTPVLVIKNLQSYRKAFQDDGDDEEVAEPPKKKLKVSKEAPLPAKPATAEKPAPESAPKPAAAPTKSIPTPKPPKRQPVTKQGFKKRAPKKK